MSAPANQPILDYQRRGPIIESLPDGGILITVPARRTVISYGAAFMASTTVDILMLPLMPLMFTIGVVAYLLLGKATPRAIIRITRQEISLQASRDNTLGRTSTFASWPTADITEFRANRFDHGLYLRIAGKENLDLLTDLPDEWSKQIESAMAPVLELFWPGGDQIDLKSQNAEL